MAVIRHQTAAHRRWLLLLVAAALCVRALVPAGWMPVAGPQGVELALCDGSGPAMPAAMAMTHGHRGAPMQHHHGAPDHQCAFAAAAATFAAEWPAGSPPLPLPHRQPLPVRSPVAVARGLAAPPPPPTGPPAFA